MAKIGPLLWPAVSFLNVAVLTYLHVKKKVVSQTDPTQRYANLGASTIPHKPKHLSLLQGQKSETRQPQYCTTENDAALLLIATID
jgi:hypothetical protein